MKLVYLVLKATFPQDKYYASERTCKVIRSKLSKMDGVQMK